MSSTYVWYNKPKRRILSETYLVYKQYRVDPIEYRTLKYAKCQIICIWQYFSSKFQRLVNNWLHFLSISGIINRKLFNTYDVIMKSLQAYTLYVCRRVLHFKIKLIEDNFSSNIKYFFNTVKQQTIFILWMNFNVCQPVHIA